MALLILIVLAEQSHAPISPDASSSKASTAEVVIGPLALMTLIGFLSDACLIRERKELLRVHSLTTS